MVSGFGLIKLMHALIKLMHALVLFCFAVFPQGSPSGVSKGAIVGIVLGSVAAAVTITAIIALIIMRKRMKGYAAISRRKRCKHFFSFICVQE